MCGWGCERDGHGRNTGKCDPHAPPTPLNIRLICADDINVGRLFTAALWRFDIHVMSLWIIFYGHVLWLHFDNAVECSKKTKNEICRVNRFPRLKSRVFRQTLRRFHVRTRQGLNWQILKDVETKEPALFTDSTFYSFLGREKKGTICLRRDSRCHKRLREGGHRMHTIPPAFKRGCLLKRVHFCRETVKLRPEYTVLMRGWISIITCSVAVIINLLRPRYSEIISLMHWSNSVHRNLCGFVRI